MNSAFVPIRFCPSTVYELEQNQHDKQSFPVAPGAVVGSSAKHQKVLYAPYASNETRSFNASVEAGGGGGVGGGYFSGNATPFGGGTINESSRGASPMNAGGDF